MALLPCNCTSVRKCASGSKTSRSRNCPDRVPRALHRQPRLRPRGTSHDTLCRFGRGATGIQTLAPCTHGVVNRDQNRIARSAGCKYRHHRPAPVDRRMRRRNIRNGWQFFGVMHRQRLRLAKGLAYQDVMLGVKHPFCGPALDARQRLAQKHRPTRHAATCQPTAENDKARSRTSIEAV